MASTYPTAYDDFPTIVSGVDSLNDTEPGKRHSDQHNNANDAIEAIERELGVNPSGSYATVADRLLALGAGEALGWVNAGLIADAVRLTDGSIGSGSTALNSAAGLFAANDVGKPINISTVRYISDATTTANGTALTAASGPFTSADVGRTVTISGAGTTGDSFTTTIVAFVSPTEVTLAAATPTAKSAVVAGIMGLHHTTIAAFVRATEVTLTAAPTWGGTGLNVGFGTDQRTTLNTKSGDAISAKKPLYIGPGDHFLVLPSTNPWVRNAITGKLKVIGAGDGETRLFIVKDARPTGDGGLWSADTAGQIEVQDVYVEYIGIPGQSSADLTNPIVENHTGGSTTGTQVLRLRRVETKNLAATRIQGGSSSKSRMFVDDCYLVSPFHVLQYYRSTAAGNDHELHVRSTYLENTYPIHTAPGDTQFNAHVTYVHPNVSQNLENGESNCNIGHSRTSPSHVRQFGSPTETPKFARIRGWRFRGVGLGVFANPNSPGVNSTGVTHISQCTFECGGGVTTQVAPVVIESSVFRTLGEPLTLTTTAAAGVLTARISDCLISDDRSDKGSFNLVTLGGMNTLWESCTIYLRNPVGSWTRFAGMPNAASHHEFRGCHFHGDASGSHYGFHFNGASGMTFLFEGCIVTGTWTGFITTTSFAGTNDILDVNFVSNQFRQTSGSVISTTIGNGNVRGQDNYIGAGTPWLASGQSASFVPPHRRNPTALSVASNAIAPGYNHDRFDVTGDDTTPPVVNNIYVGGDANNNRARGGDLYLKAVTGKFTLAHNAGGTGNIRTKTGANRDILLGETVHLRADERNGLWEEVL